MTYPSDPGSDVYRSASFWSLPSLVSTPACSEQSVQTQRSKDGEGRLRVLLDYPAHSEHTRVLEEADLWRSEKLRVKLSAVAQACRAWEDMLAKSASVGCYVEDTLWRLGTDASLLQKDLAPHEAGPEGANEALELKKAQDAILQAAAEQSKCAPSSTLRAITRNS